MNTLKNKKYLSYGYVNRYSGAPIYYDTLTEKEIVGIINDIDKDAPHFTHIVQDRETLDSIALKYYNNPTYWWIIALFNNIQDAFIDDLKQQHSILQIPNIGAITFSKEKR
jgi:hypothetical protein